MTESPATAAPNSTATAPGAWSPLKHRVFRILWLATVVSNIGVWFHNVAATWMMASLGAGPVMVAAVQVATMLPLRARLPTSSIGAAFSSARSSG